MSSIKKYFVEVKLDKKYKDQVSSENCEYVADFKDAIKTRFSSLLGTYDTAQLTLFRPGGITEIDPGERIEVLTEIGVGPWTPLVVTAAQAPTSAVGSFKKQLVFKGMSTEASCRKYLDALATQVFFLYDFPTVHYNPTMGDVLAAKDGQRGKPNNSAQGRAWWDYRQKEQRDGNHDEPTPPPLPNLLSAKQWDILKSLNRDTTKRIHDGQLPKTSSQKPFIVVPHAKFASNEYVDSLKSIAAIIGVVASEDDLIVKDESNLSGSSGSESDSPDKDKKL
ncbi:hypothetical protein HDU96_001296 [Phlyctochytrium bullatum]|nr:hypothetical protein HDU96_001296 [Phlyctochytrium bullatum]